MNIQTKKKKLDKYFLFFVIASVGSFYINTGGLIDLILSILFLTSLVLLIINTVKYKKLKDK